MLAFRRQEADRVPVQWRPGTADTGRPV